MISRHDEAALRSGTARNFLKVLQLNVTGEILPSQARTPQKVEHCSREMLK